MHAAYLLKANKMYNTLAQESLANNFLNNLDNLNETETRAYN
jgi:hypothetical protein